MGEANLQLVGLKTAIIVGVCSFLIAPLAAAFLVSVKGGGKARGECLGGSTAFDCDANHYCRVTCRQ